MMNTVSFEEFTYPSSDGINTVHACVWIPQDTEPRAIIQLAHGMCEYVARYDEWARRFAERGIIFCGNDHLGHGQTATAKTDLGYTATRGGADYIVEDLYTMTGIINLPATGSCLFLSLPAHVTPALPFGCVTRSADPSFFCPSEASAPRYGTSCT